MGSGQTATEVKACTKCGQSKPVAEFYRDKRRPDGLYAQCKKCHLACGNNWRRNHREAVRAADRRRYPQHRERHLAKTRRWYKDHPEWSRHKTRMRKALKRGGNGTHTAAQWSALKASYEFKCLRCGRAEPEIKLTEDHVIPLSKGGSNDIHNIQPLCVSCNSSKKAQTVDYRGELHVATPSR